MSTPEYPNIPIRLPTQLVRAAQACTAGSDDFRRMLRGICLLPDGHVQSANGVTAFRGATQTQDIEPIPMQQVILIHSKVPPTRETCEFEWHDCDHGTVRCIDTKKGQKPDVLAAFEVLHEVRDLDDMTDEIFPDLDKLFAYQPTEAVSTIGMSTTVLAAAAKTFGTWAQCALHFHGTAGSVTVQPIAESWAEYQASMLMMPCMAVDEDSSAPVSGFGLESFDLQSLRIEFDEEPQELDALFDQARDLVKETRKVSNSYIQRRMKVGYNRASRIVEQLEANGIVSPIKSNGTREVL